MIYFLSMVHILACIFIIIFILLQDPKGGVLGVLGGGGGGSKSLFGSGGASVFLVSVTKWLTVVFVITSVALSYLSATNKESDLMLKTPSTQSPTSDSQKKPSEK